MLSQMIGFPSFFMGEEYSILYHVFWILLTSKDIWVVSISWFIVENTGGGSNMGVQTSLQDTNFDSFG